MARRISIRRPRHTALRMQLARYRGFGPLANLNSLTGMAAAFRFYDDLFGETDARRAHGSDHGEGAICGSYLEVDDGLPF